MLCPIDQTLNYGERIVLSVLIASIKVKYQRYESINTGYQRLSMQALDLIFIAMT